MFIDLDESFESKIFDCIIIGAGVSGLKCAHSLSSNEKPCDVIVLEAQDYIGGRVQQDREFIPGIAVELGAEILHGSGNELTKFAAETGEPLQEIYCWAHGDGGPDLTPHDGYYGLYFVSDTEDRLLRFDDKDADFVALNDNLWSLADLNHSDFSSDKSLLDYLSECRVPPAMIRLADAGFANTLCSNIDELSLTQSIRWTKLWNDPTAEDPLLETNCVSTEDVRVEIDTSGEHRFVNSYSCLIDHLSCRLSKEEDRPFLIHTSSPVRLIESCEASLSPLSPCSITKSMTPKRITNSHRESSAFHRVYVKGQATPFLSRTVVCTASPHVMKQPNLLEFRPPLPAEKLQALQSVHMQPALKVILKFSHLPWPAKLQGMIFSDEAFLFPEVWFRDISESNLNDSEKDERRVAGYCVGFATSRYAEAILAMQEEEAFHSLLAQLDKAFSLLTTRHMSADPTQFTGKMPPIPSSVYVGGIIKKWHTSTHPYIGGGYCSPKKGGAIDYGAALAKPCGPNNSIFFAGEATNATQPGATAHSALETGIRAAEDVKNYLSVLNKGDKSLNSP
mmetsp:Transcript_17358/g.23853  ORF Transcript_17358/g.23853 Transcript_17358/m.23853 type:complete len:564 (-) Transcript_17358:139-1830(-)